MKACSHNWLLRQVLVSTVNKENWVESIRRKTDWSENKKESKLVALRDKKRKKQSASCNCGPKTGQKI